VVHKSRTLIAAIALGVLAVTVSAAPVAAQTSPTTTAASSPNVVQIAASNPDFSTLVTAVTQAQLAATLSGEGPFTIFAPTNEAFAKVPASQLQALLADQELLTKVLTYHVVPGKVLAGDLKKKQNVGTVEGAKVKIVKKKAGAKINGAAITQTDIEGSNGVIHVIDTVLLPPDAR
jgi:uncharacterized surface protein with fasciclin (FAS1) repeats